MENILDFIGNNDFLNSFQKVETECTTFNPETKGISVYENISWEVFDPGSPDEKNLLYTLEVSELINASSDFQTRMSNISDTFFKDLKAFVNDHPSRQIINSTRTRVSKWLDPDDSK